MRLSFFIPFQLNKCRFLNLMALAFALTVMIKPVSAQSIWTGTTGDWFNGLNWSSGVPIANVNFEINNGGTAQITGGAAAFGSGYLGTTAIDSGTIEISGGTFKGTVAFFGEYGSGLVDVSGGAVTVNLGSYFGYQAGSSGTLEVSAGSYVDNTGMAFGSFSGTGELNVTGGTVTTARTFLGYGGTATGTATVTGGTWTSTTELIIGYAGSGNSSVTVDAEGKVVAAYVVIGRNEEGIGTLNIDKTIGAGGVVETGYIEERLGSGKINFDGGLLRATGNQTDFIKGFEAGDVDILDGGAFISTNGFNLTIAAPFSGEGALTKEALGTLALSGVSTYLGGTTINAGVLSVSADANLGDADGSLTFAGGNLLVTDTFAMSRATTISALSATINVVSGKTLTQDGVISGSGALVKDGLGTLGLAGMNTFGGAVQIKLGSLSVTTDAQLGESIQVQFTGLFAGVSNVPPASTNFTSAIQTYASDPTSANLAAMQTAQTGYDAAITAAAADGSLPVLAITGQATFDGNGPADNGEDAATRISVAAGNAGAIHLQGNAAALVWQDFTFGYSALTINSGSFFDLRGVVDANSIAGLQFADNQAPYGGSIANLAGTLNVSDASFSDSAAVLGGAIYSENGTLSLHHVSFAQSESSSGGAIHNTFGTLHIADSTFTNNESTNSGGAIYTEYGFANIENTTFSGSGSGYGGAIANYISDANITGGAFSGNTATSSGGGVISYHGSLSIRDTIFDGNSAGSGGGAIAVQSGSLVLSNGTFTGNSASNGGAIDLGTVVTSISGSVFIGNMATDSGGAINSYSGTTTLSDVTFAGNSAANYGGAIVNEGGVMTLAATSGHTSLLTGNSTNGVPNSITLSTAGGWPSLNVDTNSNGLVDMRDPIGVELNSGTMTVTKTGEGVWALGGHSNFTAVGAGKTGFAVDGGLLYLYGEGQVENDIPSTASVTELVAAGTIKLAGVNSSFSVANGASVVAGGDNSIVTDGTMTLFGGSTLRGGSSGVSLGGANSTKTEFGGATSLTLTAAGGITLGGMANLVALDTADTFTLRASLGGGGGLEKTGPGNVVLTQPSTYVGGTTISNGTLVVNNTSGSATGPGDVVLAGGALGGDGFVSGIVRFIGPAAISPGNSPGTLTVGGLVMRPDSALNMELNTPGVVGAGINDLIEVTGNLTLDGRLNIINNGVLSQGTYRLINYGGTLTNSGLDVGSLPTGVNPGNLLLDTASAGQVNLIYALTTSLNVTVVDGAVINTTTGAVVATNFVVNQQYWDGSNNSADGVISGGSGIWTMSDTNWTNVQGLINGAWAGQTAVFTAMPGTVTLGSNIPFQKLIFEVGGYRIVGGSYQLYSTDDAEIETLSGTTTLNATTVINGRFTKSGAGKLDLQSPLTASGGTVISQGALAVNSVLTSPSVLVNHDATLMGAGLIIGNVTNSGTVAPGNSIGTLSIDGNYTQRSNGTLQIELTSPSNHDLLVVTGTAKLSGTLEIVSLGYDAEYGDQIPFLLAKKITGKFGQIEMPQSDLYRGRFLSEDGVGVLLVAPASYTLVASTPNEHSLALALDEWIGIETGEIGEVTLALDLLREEQYAQAFNAIMPGYYESALITGIELSQSHAQILHQQLYARRIAQRFTSPQPLLSAEASGKNPKDVKSTSPVLAPMEDYRWNAWTMGSGLFSEGGLSLQPGEDFESGTYLAGADYAFSEHFALGLFASYQEGWGDYDDAGDIDLESTRFGGYATFDYAGFYANAVVGGGQTGFDVKRPIQWAYLDRNATSEPDGYEFFASLGTGYDIKAGNWTFGPQVTVQYSDLQLGEFTEVGAGSLNLRVKEAEMESLRSYLGGRVAYTIQVNENFAIIPEFRAFWQHEYLDGGAIHAVLDSGFGGGFDYQTEQPDKDAVYLGLGLGFQIGPRMYANVYYNADFGRNDDANHTISVSATFKF